MDFLLTKALSIKATSQTNLSPAVHSDVSSTLGGQKGLPFPTGNKVIKPKCTSDSAKHYKWRNSVDIKPRQLPTVNRRGGRVCPN